MTEHRDIFRPRRAPASVLYDAFQEEAQHRRSRQVGEWTRLELEAVHRAAATYAAQHGLHAPSAGLGGLWLQVGAGSVREDEHHLQHREPRFARWL